MPFVSQIGADEATAQTSLLPVSTTNESFWGGVPISTSAKYCEKLGFSVRVARGVLLLPARLRNRWGPATSRLPLIPRCTVPAAAVRDDSSDVQSRTEASGDLIMARYFKALPFRC